MSSAILICCVQDKIKLSCKNLYQPKFVLGFASPQKTSHFREYLLDFFKTEFLLSQALETRPSLAPTLRTKAVHELLNLG